jgi:plastocyanin domain-containing protein
MTVVLVDAAGIMVIGLIVWWFWLSGVRPTQAADSGPIEITADGGVYSPASIEVPAGRPVTLRFIRKDPNPCAEKVLFTDLDVSGDLEVDKPKDIQVTAPAPGEYEFTCQMGMYRGKLVAK